MTERSTVIQWAAAIAWGAGVAWVTTWVLLALAIWILLPHTWTLSVVFTFWAFLPFLSFGVPAIPRTRSRLISAAVIVLCVAGGEYLGVLRMIREPSEQEVRQLEELHKKEEAKRKHTASPAQRGLDAWERI